MSSSQIKIEIANRPFDKSPQTSRKANVPRHQIERLAEGEACDDERLDRR
jgi:hypothetical protein